MKLVHKSLTACIAASLMLTAALPALDAQKPPYLAHFDPAKGFKPAQANFTEIFLQLAGSMEHYGSPAPYLRHIQSEESRIAKQFKLKTGKEMNNYRPAYMTDAYIDQLNENWDGLAPKLRLNALAKDAGMSARKAILGSSGNGTVLIDLFNYHQKTVVAYMEGGKPVGFEELRKLLSVELEFDKSLKESLSQSKVAPQSEQMLAILVEHEKALNASERKEYARFLRMLYFTKAEFGPLERFYEGPYDRLTEQGKGQMSKRIWEGIRGAPPNPRLEALQPTRDFRRIEAELFSKIEGILPSEKAQEIEAAINSVFVDLGHMANTELELAIMEAALK